MRKRRKKTINKKQRVANKLKQRDKARAAQRLKFWILGVPLFIVGILSTWKGYDEAKRTRSSLHWPKAPGVILSADIETIRQRDPSWKVSVTHTIKVQYQFKVQGKVYVGNRFDFGFYSTNSLEEAKKWLAPFPKGKKVQVAYKKGEPHMNVLNPGTPGSSRMYLFTGLALCLLGISLIGFVERRQWKANALKKA